MDGCCLLGYGTIRCAKSLQPSGKFSLANANANVNVRALFPSIARLLADVPHGYYA